jgi:DMSO reductase anchor subunit
MLQTLPLVLFIVMAEVSIGAVSVLVFLDWRNEVKRGFLISYALIYLVLTWLTYLLQQNFSNATLLNTFHQLDKAWTGYLSLPLQLFFLFLIVYSLFLLLDKHAGVQDKKPIDESKEYVEETEKKTTQRRIPLLRILRLVSGVATVVAGLTTLLVIAMIYRPMAAGNLGGIFTVASFFAAAFALGGVLTAMWLGHWYLVTPALSERPLQFSTTLVLIAVLTQVIFALASGSAAFFPANQPAPSANSSVVTPTPASTPVPANQIKPADAPVITPLSTDAIGWIRILIGFVMPLVLGALSWKLIRDRSFQSATGMLYLVVVCALAGEIMARGLFLTAL